MSTRTYPRRARPRWPKGWEAIVTIVFDDNQLTLREVAQLLTTMGSQIGIGVGRPAARLAMGWGAFKITEVIA